MLLRICLILAILTGLGVVAVSHLLLRPQIQGIIDTRETNFKNWKTQETRGNKLQKDLKETQGTLDTTKKNLAEKESELASTTTKLHEELKRAVGLQQKLDKTSADLTGAQQTLSAWGALGITVDQVKGVIDSEKKLRADKEVLEAEKKILERTAGQLQAKVDEYEKGLEEAPPALPPGVRGKVLVVDPKWNFVVLDVGTDQGLKPRGVMLVSRNSKLIAKVRIMTVQTGRSIANIMPGWKLGDVLEGDLVMP